MLEFCLSWQGLPADAGLNILRSWQLLHARSGMQYGGLSRAPMATARCIVLQDLYRLLPIALSPVLGNPVALAAKGIPQDLSLPQQASSCSRNPSCVQSCSTPTRWGPAC